MRNSMESFGARWIVYLLRFWFFSSTGRLLMVRLRSWKSYWPATARRWKTSGLSVLLIVTLGMYGSWLPLSSTQMLYGFAVSSHGGELIDRLTIHGVTAGRSRLLSHDMRSRK